MILYDDIYEKGQMMIEVYQNNPYQYSLFHHVQVHVHDDENMDEIIPKLILAKTKSINSVLLLYHW
jgi:hypothetical protein